MVLWKFTPAVADYDARWLGGPIWSEVIVRAGMSGQAKWIAADWENDLLAHDPTAHAAGGSAMDRQSALADPILYSLREIADPDAAGKPGFLRHGRKRRPADPLPPEDRF